MPLCPQLLVVDGEGWPVAIDVACRAGPKGHRVSSGHDAVEEVHHGVSFAQVRRWRFRGTGAYRRVLATAAEGPWPERLPQPRELGPVSPEPVSVPSGIPARELQPDRGNATLHADGTLVLRAAPTHRAWRVTAGTDTPWTDVLSLYERLGGDLTFAVDGGEVALVRARSSRAARLTPDAFDPDSYQEQVLVPGPDGTLGQVLATLAARKPPSVELPPRRRAPGPAREEQVRRLDDGDGSWVHRPQPDPAQVRDELRGGVCEAEATLLPDGRLYAREVTGCVPALQSATRVHLLRLRAEPVTAEPGEEVRVRVPVTW